MIGFNRDIVFIENHDVQMSISAGIIFEAVQFFQVCLGNFVNRAFNFRAFICLDGSFAAVPFAGPAGKNKFIVRQDGAEFRFGVGAALPHLRPAQIGGISEIVHYSLHSQMIVTSIIQYWEELCQQVEMIIEIVLNRRSD